jgi:predicted nucleic acid-binding protein
MLRVLLDTNTIVSGLFFRGNERRLLVLALTGGFKLVLPEDVYNETLRVVAEKFSDSEQMEDALLLFRAISDGSERVERVEYKAHFQKGAVMASHRGDGPVIAAVIGTAPDIFVTGDNALLRLADALPVLSSRNAIGRIGKGAAGGS